MTNREQGADGISVDCYVRVSLAYSNSDIGRAVTMKGQNTTDWVYSDDGFLSGATGVGEGNSSPISVVLLPTRMIFSAVSKMY